MSVIKNRAQIENVKLLASEKAVKRDRDLAYMMEHKPEYLLFSYYTEAGLNGLLRDRLADMPIHDSWDNPLCQIRGTFTGHWLSAAARLYQETGNMELKGRADYVVAEIARCQERNGDGWAFSIPEKFLYGLKNGYHYWAPQYVCHKTMMGLLDMYQFAGNEKAFEILKGCADWFYSFTADITRENMDHMMDLEETGGIMELWADLYSITKDERHLELMYRYERPKLTEPVLRGEDVLTNMHANMTIPEIHGCARAYEVTGEERYRKIVENYWDLAVTQRGTFATGGQTDAELWTAKKKLASRLSALNQEHCVVYQMIRLADYLYRWSGKAEYLDYIEKNIENGLMAQGFWEAVHNNKAEDKLLPTSGLISYFLPLAAGSCKNWGYDDFWCCQCTVIQANAKYREYVFYQSDDCLTVAQFIPAEIHTEFDKIPVRVSQTAADLAGDFLTINPVFSGIEERPDYIKMDYEIQTAAPVTFGLQIRLPWWLKGKAKILVNGVEISYEMEDHFAVIRREWRQDMVEVILTKKITCCPLPDDPNMVAFMDGPVVLGGLVNEERILVGDIEHPETMIRPYHEREWYEWTSMYRTVNQMRGFYFKPLKEIGNQTYTVYFPVIRK